MNDSCGANLSHGIGDIAGLRDRQTDSRIADDMYGFLLYGFVGDVIDFTPAFITADQLRFHGVGACALRRNEIDNVVFHFVARFRRQFFSTDVNLLDLL